MIVRIILVLFGFALAGAHAASATYQRNEDFASSPKNWRHFHPNQFYGFELTHNTGGTGAAGGLFQPKTYFNYYADAFLNGALRRDTPITASGRLVLDRLSVQPPYTNSTYICHFARGTNGFINTLGMALTGFNGSNVLCTAILEFSDGTAFIGNSIGLPVAPGSRYLPWTYSWNPNGGTQGFGQLIVQVGGPSGGTSTINLTKSTAGLDFSLDAFGLFQPPFPAPNSTTFLKLDIGHLAYTALTGAPPVLHIHAPKQITTAVSPLVLTGTAHVSLGNHIQAVSFRVVHGSKVGPYHTATGGANWSASVRLPGGPSRIDVLAVADSGLTTTGHRRVNRVP
ncbi:MAG: hypothetical protein PHC88_05260 [Terrimicrobiaceae bacterium]|nr:hypothetical protein [Terrimicrobiaceae bacterium]